MRILTKQKDPESAHKNCRGLHIGEMVIVERKGKKIPGIVVSCDDISCRKCLLGPVGPQESCTLFIGDTEFAVIPMEDEID